jgi:FkbM family methyltransferase
LVRRGRFRTDEPEFDRLDEYVRPGDWVIDVGANVGHYVKRLSDLVGAEGLVIALEPIADTFALLSWNALQFRHGNVTLLHVAASDRQRRVGFHIPRFASGLPNYYEASISETDASVRALAIRLDALQLEHRISLLKIDAEGHDEAVLRGVDGLVRRDRPTLIVETVSPAVERYVGELGYEEVSIRGSHNRMFRHRVPPLHSSEPRRSEREAGARDEIP